MLDPDNPDNGEAVATFAKRAETSTRTVYRVLSGKAGLATDPPSMRLAVSDRMVTAAGAHLSECDALQSGQIVPYNDVV